MAITSHTVFMLTHPPRRTYASALARGRPGDPGELRRGDGSGLKYESWSMRWRGLELPVWDIKGDDAGGPAIILSHGWGDSRVGGLTRASTLLPLCSRLVLWDLPGHGEAPGICTLGTREVDALTTLIERLGGQAPIVLFGWSLGAGVSIAAATTRNGGGSAQIAGVIAEAPYRFPWTPARNVLRAYRLPWRINLPLAMWGLGLTLCRGHSWPGFDRAGLAQRVACPLLVIHGEADEVCPVADGRTIAETALQGRLCVVAGAGHHGLWTEPTSAAVCGAAVEEMLGRLVDTAERGARAN